MRKLLLLTAFLFMVQLTYAQLDNTTMNKIKGMYYTAEELYKKGAYTETLDKIKQIETAAKGMQLATAQNLKVKALVGAKRFQEAQKELDILYSQNPDEAIFKDIAQYSSKIDEGIKSEQLARVKRAEAIELAKLKELQKEQKKTERIASAKFGYKGLPTHLGLIKEGEKYGIIDQKGDIFAPLKYKTYSFVSPYVYKMYRNDNSEDIYTQEGLFRSNVYTDFILLLKSGQSTYTRILHLLVISIEDEDDNIFEKTDDLYDFKRKQYLLRKEVTIYPETEAGSTLIEFERLNKKGARYTPDNYTFNLSRYLN